MAHVGIRNPNRGVNGYSVAEVFLESPVFVQPDPDEKKRGRKRKYPKLIETNPLPVKVSELGKCVAEETGSILRSGGICRALRLQYIYDLYNLFCQITHKLSCGMNDSDWTGVFRRLRVP